MKDNFNTVLKMSDALYFIKKMLTIKKIKKIVFILGIKKDNLKYIFLIISTYFMMILLKNNYININND